MHRIQGARTAMRTPIMVTDNKHLWAEMHVLEDAFIEPQIQRNGSPKIHSFISNAMEGSKRRKTASMGPQSGRVGDDVQASIVGELCSRLRLCRDANGIGAYSIDTDMFDSRDVSQNLQLAAQQAAFALQAAIAHLQDAIDGADVLASGDQASMASSLEQARELIAYAHRLSFTTSAPPGFIPGQTPLLHFKPPAPQDLQLRSSALHQFQREYQLRQKAGVKAATYVSPPKGPAAASAETKEATLTITAPVNLADILSTLPPMPEGWKPGDAIPGLPGAATAAEPLPQGPGPAATAAVPTAAEKLKETAPPPVSRPLSAAFDFALNPDLEMEFDVEDSGSESDSDSDSD